MEDEYLDENENEESEIDENNQDRTQENNDDILVDGQWELDENSVEGSLFD